MVRITLVCAAGMSTSMLMKKMETYAKNNSIDASVIAIPEGKLESKLDETDVVLIGPQLSFIESDLKKKLEPLNIPVSVIPMLDYGTMNGEKVIKLALNLIK